MAFDAWALYTELTGLAPHETATIADPTTIERVWSNTSEAFEVIEIPVMDGLGASPLFGAYPPEGRVRLLVRIAWWFVYGVLKFLGMSLFLLFSNLTETLLIVPTDLFNGAFTHFLTVIATMNFYDVLIMFTFPFALFSSSAFLAMELVQMYEEGFLAYFDSAWNYLDITAFGLQIIVDFQIVLFELIPSTSVYLRPTASLSLLLLFIKILFYARGFKSWGTLVRMVGEIIRDMGSFMLILMVIVAGFGLAFWVNLHDEDPDFGDPITAIFSVLSAGVYGQGDPEAMGTSTITGFLSQALMIIISLVLLNLLIAIMGETFHRILDKALLEAVAEKASIILEIEDVWLPTLFKTIPPKWKAGFAKYTGIDLRPSAMEETFPQWLHVLVAKESDAMGGAGGVDGGGGGGGGSVGYGGEGHAAHGRDRHHPAVNHHGQRGALKVRNDRGNEGNQLTDSGSDLARRVSELSKTEQAMIMGDTGDETSDRINQHTTEALDKELADMQKRLEKSMEKKLRKLESRLTKVLSPKAKYHGVLRADAGQYSRNDLTGTRTRSESVVDGDESLKNLPAKERWFINDPHNVA